MMIVCEIAKIVTDDEVICRKIVFADDIENIPSVIPKGVTVTDFADKCRECGKQKKGKWIAKSFHEVCCDNCKFDFDIMTNEFMDKMKYCPNCGAKMEVQE